MRRIHFNSLLGVWYLDETRSFVLFVRLHLLIVVLLYFHAGYWIAMMRYMNELRVRMNWQEGQSSKI